MLIVKMQILFATLTDITQVGTVDDYATFTVYDITRENALLLIIIERETK